VPRVTPGSAWLTDVRVCPSILSADFGAIRGAVRELLDAGARTFHVDVMDGHFVPVITFGTGVVSALADDVHEAGGQLAVHMMVERPERFISDFARAGADAYTVHIEATPHIAYWLEQIRAAGMAAGLTLNPGTSMAAIDAAAGAADNLLVMSVNPGWGGQVFIPSSLSRLTRMRRLASAGAGVEVDGGVSAATSVDCYHAGANRLTAGSAIFGQPDPAAAYQRLVQLVREAAPAPWQ
jgi:ribulose-phosphate 3-epimerase